MANPTITVDEQVLRRARIRPVQRDASVNRHRAETLEWYAQDAAQDAVDEIIDGLDRPGGRPPSRVLLSHPCPMIHP